MATVFSAATSGDVDRLLEACELFEFESDETPPDVACRCAALHILANLVKGDLNSARFVWKRVPQEMREAAPELQAAWALGQALWRADLPAFYAALGTYEWSSEAAAVVPALREAVRARQLALLSRAYTKIEATEAAKFLGVEAAEAATMCTDAGWSVDGEFLVPGSASGGSGGAAGDGALGEEHLEQLTQYVVHLERGRVKGGAPAAAAGGAGGGAGAGAGAGGGDAVATC